MAGLDVTTLKRRAGGLLQGFTRGQKTMLGVAVLAAVVGAYAFLSWASTPSWAPLYSGLPAEEAASVTDELDSMGVAYKLEGGDTILVGRDDVYQTRLDLSAKGLPADGAPGYDLLDDQGITTSEFKQRVDYQRALEGELVKTIVTIDGVEGADVHLVIPEDDLFSEDAVRPTASVLLTTRSDTTLSSGQVQAIVHLVASSVEGLQSTDVTVADQTGRMLAAPGEDGATALAGDARSGQTAAFERRLATSIQDLITPLTGAGRSRVQVTADLDFDKVQRTSETFDAGEDPRIVDETTTDEQYTGGNPAVGGVLGADAVPVTDSSGEGTDYTKTQADRTFAVDKVTEQVDAAPGDVRRLSVAVLLDEGTKVDEAKVSSLVAAAAGIDLERGDQLEITSYEFDKSAIPAPIEAAEDAKGGIDSLMPMLQVGATVLIVVVVLLLAWRSARKTAVARYPLAIPLGGAVALPEGGGLDGLDGFDATLLDRRVERSIGPSPEEQQQMVVQSQIGDLIDRQPDEVAQVLRGWLADRRS